MDSQWELRETDDIWLPALPSHWSIRPMKSLFDERSVKGHPNEPLLAASQSRGVVTKEEYGLRTVVAQSGLESLKLVEPGDFVISLRSFEGGIEVSHARGIISPAYTVLRLKNQQQQRFIMRLLKSRYFLDAIRMSVTGIREGQSINYSRLGTTDIPIPTEGDMLAINRFLDHAELRIARALQAKEMELSGVIELRTATVAREILGSRTSKVLNPYLPYRVPDHWQVVPLWSVAPLRSDSGHGNEQLLSVYLNRGVILYSESGGQVHKPSASLDAYQLVEPGDLVLNNQQAWRGSVGVSSHRGIISPAYVVCALDSRIDWTWANFLFRSPAMVDQFVMASRGVGSIQRQLHMQSLRRIMVPLPPLEDQRETGVRLSNSIRELDEMAISIQREIDLLREYRTRLIADVVTGKKDVRAEAANLPEVDPLELAQVLSGASVIEDDVEEEVSADAD